MTTAHQYVPHSDSARARAVAYALMVAGAAVRVEQFLSRRSLWLDEAMLANNIVGRGYGRLLLQKLADNQAAPPGFLWLERLATQVLGRNEYALRIVPLAAGVAVLPLLWLLARRTVGDAAAAGAVAFVALSPAAVRYSTEVKQYSSDAFVVLAVLAAAWWASERFDTRRAVLFAGVSCLAVWMSHPAWFAVAVGGLLLLRTRRWRELAVAGTPVVAAAAAAYLLNLRVARDNGALDSYWASGFPDHRGRLRFLVRASWSILDDPGQLRPRALALALVVVGGVALWRHVPRLGLLIGGTAALALLAGAARVFPVRGRLVLFVIPMLGVVMAAGLAFRPLRAMTGLGLAILLVAPAGDVVDVARHPPALVEGRQAIEFVARHRQPGDLVYVHSTAAPVFDFYAPRLNLHSDGVVTCGPGDVRPTSGRAWLVYAYTLSTRPPDDQQLVGRWFGGGTKPVLAFSGEDASARLYELTAAPTDACRSLPGPVRK